MKIGRAAEFKSTVERSRFFALVAPVATEAEWDVVVKARRKEHHKATHHCSALRVRDASGSWFEKSKDDGEVGHPGRVLLEVLRQHDLEGGIVVSRVFGGVKLGIGGVSRAFREAAEGAVAACTGGPPSRETRAT